MDGKLLARLGAVVRRLVLMTRELRHENVLDLRTGIALAQQEAFPLQVGPIDDLVCS
jgi:hypothetical protein